VDDWIDRVTSAVPQLARGMVWCTVCGASLRVNVALCLSGGWPRCCGQTMTIDSPAERVQLSKEVDRG